MTLLVSGAENFFNVRHDQLPVVHGFFGRSGGVSPPPFDSLNGSIQKDALAVLNRERVYSFLGIETAFFPLQAHTTRALVLPRDLQSLDQPADALVSHVPGTALGVLTADCAPVMFYSSKGIIGVAHAGCEGAISGVLENTVLAMQELGACPLDITAVIGPTIRQTAYAVDSLFLEHVSDVSPFCVKTFFKTRWERLFFDLPGYIQKRLAICGVSLVHDTAVDTFGPFFFSRRYALCNGFQEYGHSLSIIALKHTSV
jgi:YfiH family protein